MLINIILILLYLFFFSNSVVFASLPVVNSKDKVKLVSPVSNQVIVKFKEQDNDLDVSSINDAQDQSSDTETLGKVFKPDDLNLNSRSVSKTTTSFSKVNSKYKVKEITSISFDKQKATDLGLKSGFYVLTFEDNI